MRIKALQAGRLRRCLKPAVLSCAVSWRSRTGSASCRRQLSARSVGRRGFPLAEPRCFVCDKHRGVVQTPGGCLYEDQLVYASHGAMPEGKSDTYLGTLFVEPKRHAAGLEDLTDLEAQRFGLVVTWLSRALRTSTRAERIYSAVLGHHVPHLHMWLIARYLDTPPEFWGMRVLEWPQAPRGNARAVEELCTKVRDQLSASGSP